MIIILFTIIMIISIMIISIIIINIIIIIIITRPWPAFGRQDLDRSSGGNNHFCDRQTDGQLLLYINHHHQGIERGFMDRPSYKADHHWLHPLQCQHQHVLHSKGIKDKGSPNMISAVFLSLFKFTLEPILPLSHSHPICLSSYFFFSLLQSHLNVYKVKKKYLCV